jgi:ParB family chromosome partitioning protein
VTTDTTTPSEGAVLTTADTRPPTTTEKGKKAKLAPELAAALLPAAQRGLESYAAHPDDVIGKARDSKATVVLLRIDRVHEDPEKRETRPEKVEQLVKQIRAVGMRDAIEVKPTTPGDYQVTDGHHRRLAALALGWKEIPAWVRDDNDLTRAVVRAGKNMARAQLSPYEEARDFKNILDKGATVDQVAELTGVTPATVRARLKLLELPADIAQRIGKDGFGLGHAALLLPLVGHDPLLKAIKPLVAKHFRGADSDDPLPVDEWHEAISEAILGDPPLLVDVESWHFREVKGLKAWKEKLDSMPQVKWGRWSHARPTTHVLDPKGELERLRISLELEKSQREAAKSKKGAKEEPEWKKKQREGNKKARLAVATKRRLREALVKVAHTLTMSSPKTEDLLLVGYLSKASWNDKDIEILSQASDIPAARLKPVLGSSYFYADRSKKLVTLLQETRTAKGGAGPQQLVRLGAAAVLLQEVNGITGSSHNGSGRLQALAPAWFGATVQDLHKATAKALAERKKGNAVSAKPVAKVPKKKAAATKKATRKSIKRPSAASAAGATVDGPFVKDGYTLHERTVTLKGGRTQHIYFFAKGKPKEGTPCALPAGHEVSTTTRTGLPILRRAGVTVSKRSSKPGTKAKDLKEAPAAGAGEDPDDDEVMDE